MKYVLVTIVILVIAVATGNTNSVYGSTKIPYNNGFYAGLYNSKLPIIDPAPSPKTQTSGLILHASNLTTLGGTPLYTLPAGTSAL